MKDQGNPAPEPLERVGRAMHVPANPGNALADARLPWFPAVRGIRQCIPGPEPVRVCPRRIDRFGQGVDPRIQCGKVVDLRETALDGSHGRLEGSRGVVRGTEAAVGHADVLEGDARLQVGTAYPSP
jgi:hypothetical protein